MKQVFLPEHPALATSVRNFLNEVNESRGEPLAATMNDAGDECLACLTLSLEEPPEIRQPVYGCRVVTHPDQRRKGLASRLLLYAFDEVERRMTDIEQAEAIGFWLEVPAPLATVLSGAYRWPKTDFSFIGTRGGTTISHLRVRYFDKVKLKG